MRRQLLAVLMTTAVVVPALADDRRGRPTYRDDREYGRDNRGYGNGGYGRDGAYGNGGYGNGGYGRDGSYGAYGRQSGRGNPVTAAMRDLDMVYRRARVDGHEADHFRRALRELADFDQNAARGRFDRGSLDSAIDNMAHLAQADRLHPRDRQVIRQRMDDLRYVRNAGERY